MEENYKSWIVNADKFSLSLEQLKILYNLEYYKALNDIEMTGNKEAKKALKEKWLNVWQNHISLGFGTFVNNQTAVMEWLSMDDLILKIEANNPEKIWFRLVLIDLALFEPFYALSIEKDKKGNFVEGKAFDEIKSLGPANGDKFIEGVFNGKSYFEADFIKRIRNSYKKASGRLTDFLKNILGDLGRLGNVDHNVLTGDYLAFLGAGAFSVSGAGGSSDIVAVSGGAAALAIGFGADLNRGFNQYDSEGVIIGIETSFGRKSATFTSAKMIVAAKEVFLNDEGDIGYVKLLYEVYRQNLILIEKRLVDLRADEEVAVVDKEVRKDMEENIKSGEEAVEVIDSAKACIRQLIDEFK